MITNIVIAVLALVVLYKVVMLLKDKVPGIKLPSLKAKIDADIQAAVVAAQQAPQPTLADLTTDVFA